MKKISILFLALMMFVVVPFALATAESPVFIGEDVKNEGKLGEPIVVEDLFSFCIDKWNFGDSWGYYKELKTGWATLYSGMEYQLFYVYCSMFNESLEKLTYNKYLSGALLKFKDKYEYPVELVNQFLPDKDHDYLPAIPVDPLTNAYVNFVFKVPNLIETSKDQLILYLTINDVEYVFKVR